MIYNKITPGFVCQKYDSETGRCVSQEFIAGDDVVRETVDGNPIMDIEKNEVYFPMNMIQPEGGR